MLQPRFALRQKKRVFRTLAHPRFRAAFDFLELRAKVAPELAADLVFWRDAQTQAPAVLSDALDAGMPGIEDAFDAADGSAEDVGPRRRRRRRPRRSGPGAGAPA